jgi:zinc protease
VQRIVSDGIPEAELAKVQRQLRAGHLFSTEGVTNQARYLGWYEIAHTWRAYEQYVDRLAQVTSDDVVRVTATYLTPQNRTVGWFVPVNAPPRQAGAGTRAGRAVAEPAARAVPAGQPWPEATVSWGGPIR